MSFCRHNVLGLRSVGSREAITTADNLDMTLASLRWPSRVKLIATVWNEEDAERSLTQVRFCSITFHQIRLICELLSCCSIIENCKTNLMKSIGKTLKSG